jgi:hypothetical protein
MNERKSDVPKKTASKHARKTKMRAPVRREDEDVVVIAFRRPKPAKPAEQ